MILFVTGGSGSGKSEYAEKRCLELAGTRRKIYLATMENIDTISEKRVRRHRSLRAGKGFETLEKPRGLEELRLSGKPLLLLECLSGWLANEMFSDETFISRVAQDEAAREARADEIFLQMNAALHALYAQTSDLVIVSDQVFSDGIEYGETTDAYLRLLGRLHAYCVKEADEAVEVVCGIPVPFKYYEKMD